MPVEFKMPDPGEGIHEAEILEILVAEGDRVEEDQPLMRIETDKAEVELPSPVTGTVKKILVSDGDVVEVGDVLVVLLEEGEDQDGEQTKEDEAGDRASADKEQQTANEEDRKKQERKSEDAEEEPQEDKTREKEASDKKQSKSEEKSATDARKSDEEAPRKGPVPATPATRRLARELDVALDRVEPSGPGGRVTPEDVKAHAEGEGDQKKPEKERETPEADKADETARSGLPDFSQWGEVERTPLRSIRRATAKRMALSWNEIPHVTHEDLADITELEKFRRDNRDDIQNQGGALTLTVFAIKAAVAALKAYPRFNASFDSEAREIISKKYFHIGVAVDTDRGLLVPVVRDADCKSMVELAREVKELAERTRQGEVEPKDMTGGTFTITNVGPLGGTGFTPIINHPQVAILGLAKARLQPVVLGDIDDFKVDARLMLPLCLGFDHRIVDGADAARFMGKIIGLLESPENLMLSQ